VLDDYMAFNASLYHVAKFVSGLEFSDIYNGVACNGSQLVAKGWNSKM